MSRDNINNNHRERILSPSQGNDLESNAKAIIAEVEELQRQGKLDETTMDRISATVRKDIERFEQEEDRRIAEIRARFARPTPQLKPLWVRVMVLFAVFFVFASIPLEVYVGSAFIFRFANEYRALFPWLTLAMALPFWMLLYRSEERTGFLSERFPNAFTRWFVMVPLFVVSIAAVVVFSPLGWLAVSGLAVGKESAPLQAKVLSVGRFSPSRRGCDQEATLEIDGTSARVCLEDRVSGVVPKAGDTVEVMGKLSPFGLYIDEIRTQ